MQTPKPVSYQATIRDLTKRLEALERYNRSLSAGLARDPSSGAMTVRMSGDAGNQAGFGSDGGVYIAGAASPFTLAQGLVTATSPMTVSLGTGSVAARHVGEHTYATGDRVWVITSAGASLVVGNVDDAAGGSAQLLTGTITAVTGTTVSVTIGGTPHTGVAHLSSYQPQDSDTVVVADTGSALVVLGTPGGYTVPAAGVTVYIQPDEPGGAVTGDFWLQA